MKTELVTSLKRQATAIIVDPRRTRHPVLITQHGKPAAYLLHVETYTEMNRRISVLEGLALGERAIKEKRTVSHKAAKKRMARWLS
ncbi:MAG TPA: type II toxin-antitoxin system prevent-host-death family antitoxin [Opitutaceae bacterium]|nr:type II toxin-antitoxin system prevent-host-death family antitoxin [Opitutaceae bacterium]